MTVSILSQPSKVSGYLDTMRSAVAQYKLVLPEQGILA